MTESSNRNKMSYALWRMVNGGNKHQTRYKVTSRNYDFAKKQAAEALSKERKGKTLEERYGTDKAEKIRRKLKLRKRRKPLGPVERKAASERMKDHHKKAPWKRHFEYSSLDNVTCELCGKTLDPGNYAKWHKNGECQSKEVANCKRCGKEFTVVSWGRKTYCSTECFHAIPHHKANCKKCGEEFKATDARKHYCSSACYYSRNESKPNQQTSEAAC